MTRRAVVLFSAALHDRSRRFKTNGEPVRFVRVHQLPTLQKAPELVLCEVFQRYTHTCDVYCAN